MVINMAGKELGDMANLNLVWWLEKLESNCSLMIPLVGFFPCEKSHT